MLKRHRPKLIRNNALMQNARHLPKKQFSSVFVNGTIIATIAA